MSSFTFDYWRYLTTSFNLSESCEVVTLAWIYMTLKNILLVYPATSLLSLRSKIKHDVGRRKGLGIAVEALLLQLVSQTVVHHSSVMFSTYFNSRLHFQNKASLV